MFKDMTRSRLIRICFVAVILVAVAGLAFGASVTTGTGLMLLALCLVPPAIVFVLWPGAQLPTASEVLHDVDRRD